MTVIVAGVAEARRAVADVAEARRAVGVESVALVSSVENEHVKSPAMSYTQMSHPDHYLQYLI